MTDRQEKVKKWLEDHRTVSDKLEVPQVQTTSKEFKRRSKDEGNNPKKIKKDSILHRKERPPADNNHDSVNYQDSNLPSEEHHRHHGNRFSETDVTLNTNDGVQISCTSPHEGRKVVDVELQMNVDQLFMMVFNQSKFYTDFHAARKTTDIVQTPWEEDSESGQKRKKVELTVSLNQSIGPKSSRVTENYVMLPCSQPGHLYSLDLSAANSGFRYSEAFYCFSHFCLYNTSQKQSSNLNAKNLEQHSVSQDNTDNIERCHFKVFSQLIYTKAVWAPVKSIIEKSSWAGIEEFYEDLISKLEQECKKANESPNDADGQRRRKQGLAGSKIAEEVKGKLAKGLISRTTSKARHRKNKKDRDFPLSCILLYINLAVFSILNAVLYHKLISLEETTKHSSKLPTNIDLSKLRNDPLAHEEWLKLSFSFIDIDENESDSWRNDVQKTVTLLLEVEDYLRNLTKKIPMDIQHKLLVQSLHKNQHSSSKGDT